MVDKNKIKVIAMDLDGTLTQHKQPPTEQTRKTLENLGLPEVDYFLEHFIPAFELTLDELGSCQL